MSLRGSEVQALLDDLLPRFLDARIQDLRQPDATRLFIEVHGKEGRQRAVLDAESGQGRFHRVEERPTNAPTPPAFLSGCRKELLGSRVREIRADPDRNTLRWILSRGDELRHLVLQWGRKSGAIALLDADERVLVGVGRMANGRPCVPGHPLHAPEAHADPRPPRFTSVGDELARDMAAHHAQRAADDRFAIISRAIRRKLKKLRRRLERIEADLERADNAGDHQRLGELLKSELHRIQRGMESGEVTDWYAPDTPTVSVPLDPRLDGPANMNRIFHQATRFKAARALIEKRLALAREEKSALDSLAEELAQEGRDLRALEKRGRALGLFIAPRTQRRSEPRERLPYRMHRAFDGTPILVGRGAKDNDALTFKVARGNDIWLHARNRPGAHVILRRDRGAEVHPRALEDAAILAAHGARGGKDDTSVEISWTERKHVRSVRGGAPGAVTVAGARTLLVRQDPERLQQLLATGRDNLPEP